MAHVFISYVKENENNILNLRDLLDNNGVNVWLDKNDIKPGFRWKDAIREAISGGDFFVACFSKEYCERDKTYMNEELIIAIEELRQRPKNRAWFIPILLSPCDIPNHSIGAGETIRDIQWVPLYENWEKGIERILSVINPMHKGLRVLLNLDQPLLKELLEVAPGTFYHSMVVAKLVEPAAESIGANPLLTKAAAYYHDIGKIKKPSYFVENTRGGEGLHEKLTPSMSSLILISHVKDGVNIAQKHKLRENIVEIIRQHHATNLISYFFHKAKKQAANPNQVNIEDYRYPGPRPQTKEAGLIVLADQVESAYRFLSDPTPARIQGMVQKIINNVFADAQLDECELTLKDLHHIARNFAKVLNIILHSTK